MTAFLPQVPGRDALVPGRVKTCECRGAQGQYVDQINAVYWGEDVVPLGFTNSSFRAAFENQPLEGDGRTFTAFVIPVKCPTFFRASTPLLDGLVKAE